MDIETADPATGFQALAKAIALSPDYECFIFHRFDRLAARNLLHLEAKLRYLQHKLDEADKLALSPSADNESRRSIRAWEAFERNAADPSRPEHAQMKLAEQIQETFEKYRRFFVCIMLLIIGFLSVIFDAMFSSDSFSLEYHPQTHDLALTVAETALLQQNQIATLEPPRARAIAVAQHLSHSYPDLSNDPSQKSHFLAGLSANRLSNQGDLLSIRRPAEKDPLSRFLQDHWIFHTTSISAKTEYILEQHVNWVAAGVSTIVAAILLLGAILILHVLEDRRAQLGVIGMLTVLFAGSVALLTNARRSEVFASTAAYAAVLVVFVSSEGNTGPAGCICSPG
jgi:hypothetical protein